MMYVDSDTIRNYVSIYGDAVLAIIINKFNSENKIDLMNDADALEYIMTETGLLDEQYNLNEALILEMLTRPVDELISSYDWIRCYFNSVQFAYNYKEYFMWKIDRRDYPKNNIALRNHYLNMVAAQGVWYSNSLTQEERAEIIRNKDNFEEYMRVCKNNLILYANAFSYFFNYDWLTDSIKSQLRLIYNLDVCPYCNREFVTHYVDKGRMRVVADLDHIFIKSLFPLFSLNIYNLVPVCRTCNTFIKGNRMLEVWHPFVEGFNDSARFTIDNLTHPDVLAGNSNEFEIVLRPIEEQDASLRELSERTIYFYKFNELYDMHKNYVQEIIFRFYHIYTKNMMGEIVEISKLNNIQLDEDAIRLLYGFSLSGLGDINKHLLGKLTVDVVEQLFGQS